MLRHRFGTTPLAALALGALALSAPPAPAQIVYEFADATTGAAQTDFSVPAGGALPIRIYLHELTPGAPLFHSAGGLGTGAVRLSFDTPPGVAGLSVADVAAATAANGGPWDFGTPTLSALGTSAALAVGALPAGVPPDAPGRVLLGTFTLHGLAPGTLTLGAADPNPATGFDTSSFAIGANAIPLINYDPLITAGAARLTVTPVSEPGGLGLACLAASLGWAAYRRRRAARAIGPGGPQTP
jgi:hypothetical protein